MHWITLVERRLAFRPGEKLCGTASWQLARAPKQMEVRLCWFTEGIAIPEAEMVARCVLQPSANGTQPFQFILPASPYSFRGCLTALSWAVELVVLPRGPVERIVFSLSPSGEPWCLVRDAVLPVVPKAA